MIDWLEQFDVSRLSHTLLHFLWQGFAAAGALAIALNLAARATSRVRYAISVVALFLTAAAPFATFIYLGPKLPPLNEVADSIGSVGDLSEGNLAADSS